MALPATEEENHVEDGEDGDEDFQDERPRLIISIRHGVVEFAKRVQLLFHQSSIILHAHPRSRKPVDSGVVDVADKLDRVVNALGQSITSRRIVLKRWASRGRLQRESSTFLFRSSAV